MVHLPGVARGCAGGGGRATCEVCGGLARCGTYERLPVIGWALQALVTLAHCPPGLYAVRCVFVLVARSTSST